MPQVKPKPVEKYFLVPERELITISEMVKKLTLGQGLQIWNNLINIVEKYELKGPLPKAPAPKRKKK